MKLDSEDKSIVTVLVFVILAFVIMLSAIIRRDWMWFSFGATVLWFSMEISK